MTRWIREAIGCLAALLVAAPAALAQELPSLPDMPKEGRKKAPAAAQLPDLPDPNLPSLDELDPETLREKSLCVFPFIQAEAGSSDAARSKYQESLQQVFYDVAKASPVLKDPLILKRPPACGYRDTACIAGVGGFSRCENVLVGSSTPVDNGFLLSVRLIDVGKKKVAARVDEVVVAEKEDQIAAWAEGHACRALKVPCKGEVVLDLDRPDMVAVIDKKPLVRKTPAAGGKERVSLAAGLHSVRVSIGGRSSLERPLVIRRNAAPSRITARQLSDCAIPVTVGSDSKNTLPQPGSVECRGANVPRIVGLALGAAGVVAAGFGGYEGLKSKSDADDARAHVRANNGIAVPADLSKMDSANNKATTANIAFGAAAGLLITGAVLYFVFGGDK